MKRASISSNRPLSVLSLAMINIAALGSIKNWPIAAEYGLSSLFYLLLACLVFFIPVALVSAEMATGWPKTGGVFVWVKEAFGHRTGFLAIWLLWLENVLWYPTILSFLSATIAFIFNASLSNNPYYMAGMILILFWACTLANLRGMKTSSWISTFSVIFGTFIAGLIIILLGAFWLNSGRPLQISLRIKDALPSLSSVDQLVFFTGMILSFCGMEMSAIHAREVEKPQKDYPKAILITVVTIIALSLMGVLSIAIVIPKDQINLTAGSLQAFAIFVDNYGLSSLTPIMAILIAIGALGSVSTWIVGPSKGLLAAAKVGDLPPLFRRINSRGMPVSLMVVQAIVVSILSMLFIFMPSVSSAYLLIVVVVSQLYLLMYILMFAAAIKLRYKRPDVIRAYKIPGGNMGMWIVCSIGILACLFTFCLAFIPPSSLSAAKTPFYVGFLLLLTLLGCLGPFFILKCKKESWNHPLPHEK